MSCVCVSCVASLYFHSCSANPSLNSSGLVWPIYLANICRNMTSRNETRSVQSSVYVCVCVREREREYHFNQQTKCMCMCMCVGAKQNVCVCVCMCVCMCVCHHVQWKILRAFTTSGQLKIEISSPIGRRWDGDAVRRGR